MHFADAEKSAGNDGKRVRRAGWPADRFLTLADFMAEDWEEWKEPEKPVVDDKTPVLPPKPSTTHDAFGRPYNAG